MRSFFFLLIFSTSALAQIDYGSSTVDCDETDLIAGGKIQCRNLHIQATPIWNASVAPLDIQVNGDVIIDAAIDLSGGDSPDDGGNFDDFFGAAGLGGGGEGGRTGSGFPTAAPGVSGGGKGQDGPACGGGGGGGGFLQAALLNGASCGAISGGARGIKFENILVDNFRGGFGGGAGGVGSIISNGGGGGGGGAIRIRAKGNVTINDPLTSNGGAGGNSNADNGGGGGGSGGLIWIQALGNIENNAAISVTGGAGGSSSSGGAGSAGSKGLIRFEDLDGIITGSNPIAGVKFPSKSLKSDISCGTVKNSDENHSAFFQMILGFCIVAVLSNARRLRWRS